MRRALCCAVLLCTTALAAPALAAPAVADAQPAAACRNVSGTLSAVAIPQLSGGVLTGFHVIGTEVTGDFAGATVTADLVVTSAGPGGTLMLGGHHYFVDEAAGLDLATEDFVRTSPDGVVNDTLQVSGGGVGTLHTRGTVDLATGAVELAYWGRVCVDAA